MSIKKSNYGIYSGKQIKKIGSIYIHTIKFTMKRGLEVYRWYLSPNKTNIGEYCLWHDKNERARKDDRRFFLTREEAIEVAISRVI